jgi:hypothetical protein
MKKKPESKIGLSGYFDVAHIRGGTIIQTMQVENGATRVGVDVVLNAGFAGGGGFSNLYIGLIKFLDAVHTPTAVPTVGDTMGSNGWLAFEFTEYASPTRLAVSMSGASSFRIGSSEVQFDIEAGANLQGFFVTDNNVKGGTTGTLWASAVRTFFTEGKSFLGAGSPISNDFSVLNGDQLRVKYAVRMQPTDV